MALASVTSPAAAGPSATATAGAGLGSTDPAQMQDRFLKLLVAQLHNQDPMNPMDNAQMTSQMAQINTVTGISQLNDTVKGITQQFQSMQLLQSASLVGHEVLVPGNRFIPDANGTGQGDFDLAGPAAAVRVDILSPGGAVVGSVDLGAQDAGRKTFSFDASAYQGGGQLTYRVVATNGAQTVANTPYTRDKVAAVSMGNGALMLQLAGGSQVKAGDIASVL